MSALLSALDDIPLVVAFLLTLILGIEVQRCMYNVHVCVCMT